MLIPVECAQCKAHYNLNATLIGKKVRCKSCGATILVVAPPTGQSADVLDLTEPPPAPPPTSIRVPDPRLAPDVPPDLPSDPQLDDQYFDASAPAAPKRARPDSRPVPRVCPECNSVIAADAVVCNICGSDPRVGRTAAASVPGGSLELAEYDARRGTRKNRRSTRIRGSELLNRIDTFLALGIWLLLAGGITAWLVSLARATANMSFFHVLPTIVVVLLVLVVMGPLIMLAIQAAAYFAKFEPRSDSLHRILLVLVLPLSVSLLGGSQANNPGISELITAAWCIAPLLFLYLFRDDWYELGVTAGTFIVALLLTWQIAVFVAFLISLVSGPLYADALPQGIWASVATGQSPTPPRQKPATTLAIAQSNTRGSTEAVTQIARIDIPVPPVPTNNVEIKPPNTTTTGAETQTRPPDTTGAIFVGERPPVTTTAASTAVLPPIPSSNPGVGTAQPETKPGRSPIFSKLIADEPEFQNIREIAVPFAPASSTYFAVVKKQDKDVVVQRWTIDPLAKKGSSSFVEVPKRPNSYALSPRGDMLVVLTRFPIAQLQFVNLEAATERQVALSEPSAVPTLLGYLDQHRVVLRWDLGDETRLQIWNDTKGTAMNAIVIEPLDKETPLFVASPNGKAMAALGTGRRGGVGRQGPRIDLYDTSGTRAGNPIFLAENLRYHGLAFSADSTKISIVASTAEASTLLTFNVVGGTPVRSAIFLDETLNKGDAAPKAPLNLTWFFDASVWAFNGGSVYEGTVAKRIGSLNLANIVETRAMPNNTLLMVQESDNGNRKLLVGRLDATHLRSQIEAVTKH